MNRLMSYCLEKQYRVRSAANGQEALDLVADEKPDLIVSDLMMPVLDGFELLARLRADMRYRHIPFIMVTAKTDQGSRTAALKAGANLFLTKPFSSAQLVETVARLLPAAR